MSGPQLAEVSTVSDHCGWSVSCELPVGNELVQIVVEFHCYSLVGEQPEKRSTRGLWTLGSAPDTAESVVGSGFASVNPPSWLARFPYKEDVGGSSPSAPTHSVGASHRKEFATLL